MQQLKTLRLHSQKAAGLKRIAFDAFRNVNDNLTNLWLSENELTTFPHQVLSEQMYGSLRFIYAEYNNITNITELGEDAYPVHMTSYYREKRIRFQPFETLPAVEELFLRSNQITGLGEFDLCGMPNLLMLHLSDNHLTDEAIHSEAFRCLADLIELALDFNYLEYVPKAVTSAKRLPSIRRLYLSYNMLTFVETGSFTALSTLNLLYLEENRILTIEDESLPKGLRLIDLTNNDFRFIQDHPFTALSELITLTLKNNTIDIIPDDAFANCTSLDFIDLSNNRIKRLVKRHFEASPLSGWIRLHNNEIGYIENGIFSHVRQAKTITLNSNRLTRIPNGGDFRDLVLFTDIDLSDNYITSIKTGTFRNITCKNIFLQDNKIRYIEHLAFDQIEVRWKMDFRNNPIDKLSKWSFRGIAANDINLSNMFLSEIPSQTFKDIALKRHLFLNNNNITSIGIEAFSNVSLEKSLWLSDCFLKRIDGRMFSDGSSVGQWLYLQSNSLTAIPDDAFEGVTVRFLKLNNNLLTEFPGKSFQPLQLEILRIMFNNIREIPQDSFEGYTSLHTLFLTGNDLDIIVAELFRPLIHLKKLVLSMNKIKVVEYGAFLSQENSLQELELQRNQLTFFPSLTPLRQLQKLDLSRNDLVTMGPGVFDGLSLDTLTSVNLKANELECDCDLYYSLYYVRSVIVGGQCTIPSNQNLVSLLTADSQSSSHFLNQESTVFQCSAENVTASAETDYQIKVTWSVPDILYPGDFSDDLNVTFHVECLSDGVPDLRALVIVSTGRLNGTSEHVFTKADDVRPGREYVCSLRLENVGYISGKSSFAFVTTLAMLEDIPVPGQDDFLLMVTHFDFNTSHRDFSYASQRHFSSPQYVPSPYGPWLAMSDTGLNDSFSDWFHYRNGTNHVIESALVLVYDFENNTNRVETSLICSGS